MNKNVRANSSDAKKSISKSFFPVSKYDIFCLMAEKEFSPFSIQSVVEGVGTIDLNQLRNAVRKASDANPGSRFILKNNKWKDSGKYPPVVQLPHSEWNDNSIDNIELFKKPMKSDEKPTFEVYLISGDPNKAEPTRIIFRSAHSTTDGHGNKFFMEEVFRALRGEKLLGTNTSINLDELVTDISKKSKYTGRKELLMYDCKSPTGSRDGKSHDFVIKRIKINSSGKEMTARLASILAKESFDSGDNHARFLLPVDLRSQNTEIRTLRNLSSSVTIDVNSGQNVTDIQNTILKNLIEHPQGNIVRADKMVKILPRRILQLFFRRTLEQELNKNKFLYSAVISDVGKADLEALKTPSFTPSGKFNFGVNIPVAPLSIVTVKNPDHVELTISMLKDLATNGRMDKLLEKIKQELELTEYTKDNANPSGKDTHHNTLEDIKNPNHNYITDIKDTNHKSITDIIKDPIKEIGHGIVSDDFRNKTICQLFQKQVEKTPDAIAVVFKDQKLTYRQLDQKSNQLAHTLIEMGVRPEKVIPLIGDRSADMLVSVLAILKTGSSYLPIDPKAPSERRDTILADMNTDIIITQKGKLSDLPTGIKLLNMDDANIYSKRIDAPIVDTSPENLAYVIFTSGTTGKPKGIGVENKSVVNHLLWAEKEFMDKAEKHYTFPFFTTVAFDFTVLSTFLPLVTGNTIKVYENDMSIPQIAVDPEINIIKATPTHLKIMREFMNENCNIKKIISGGESFTSELANSIYEKLNKKVDIFNEYGPTEATVACICHKFDPKEDIHGQVAIGKPIDNTHIYILDKDKKPVAYGESGEIYIGGDCLARGYINLPEVNAKTYVDNPFRPGEKMYRSGDIARWIAPNNLLYESRADDQVKIRGYRIETADIENAISSFSGIKNSVVIPRKTDDSTILVAYIVADHPIDTAQLRKHLESKVNHYMIPSSFTQIDVLPTTINGKLDKRSLPEPKQFKPVLDSASKITNTSEVRGMLVDLWSNLLNLNNPSSIKDGSSFIEQGGDSLRMITLLSKIEQKLPVEKAPFFLEKRIDIIGAKTLSDMTQIIEGIMDKKTHVPELKHKNNFFPNIKSRVPNSKEMCG